MAKTSTRVNVDPAVAFEYVSDLTRHGEWASHKLSVEPLEPGRSGVGTRFASHGEQFGRKLEDTLTVTEYEPDRRFAFESAGVGGAWRHAYEISPDGDEVVITRWMEPVRLMLLLKLISPLFDSGLRKRNSNDLARLKARLESKAP